MNVMKLHMYQTTDFLCIPVRDSLFDPHGGLKQLRASAEAHGITLVDEEIAVFTTRDQLFSGSGSSIAIGAGPLGETVIPEAFHSRSISEGAYLFYQFSDSSAEGITAALQFSLQAMKARGMTPASDTVILRGVREAGFYVYQVLIPILDT